MVSIGAMNTTLLIGQYYFNQALFAAKNSHGL